MRDGRLVALAAAAVAAIATCAGPAAGATPRQTGSLTFTTTQPGAPTGTALHFDFQNPDDPNMKPYAVAQMIMHAPPGTVTDTTVPPQCHATDAEIYIEGPAACPPDTKLGGGYAITDNGPGGDPSSRYSPTTLTHFNNQDEVIGIGVNDQIPAIKTIDRVKIEGRTSTANFPLFPGVPPPEPYTPVKTLDIQFPPYTRGGQAYMRTPRACPVAGYWTTTTDFVYRDGTTQSVESHSPCQGR
jgi:hypothetical protein